MAHAACLGKDSRPNDLRAECVKRGGFGWYARSGSEAELPGHATG